MVGGGSEAHDVLVEGKLEVEEGLVYALAARPAEDGDGYGCLAACCVGWETA